MEGLSILTNQLIQALMKWWLGLKGFFELRRRVILVLLILKLQVVHNFWLYHF